MFASNRFALLQPFYAILTKRLTCSNAAHFAVEEKQPKVFIIFEGKKLFERCESLATFLGNLHDPLSHSECCKCSERDRERPLSTESREGL